MAEEELQKALADLAREGEHQQVEHMAANISILTQALQRVRSVASDALAEAAPDRTIMVVGEDGETVACCSVSDAVANDRDKKRSIREVGSQCQLSVDFVRINGRPLTSAEACKEFLRQLNGEDEGLAAAAEL